MKYKWNEWKYSDNKGRNNGQLTDLPGQISINVRQESSFLNSGVVTFFLLDNQQRVSSGTLQS